MYKHISLHAAETSHVECVFDCSKALYVNTVHTNTLHKLWHVHRLSNSVGYFVKVLNCSWNYFL